MLRSMLVKLEATITSINTPTRHPYITNPAGSSKQSAQVHSLSRSQARDAPVTCTHTAAAAAGVILPAPATVHLAAPALTATPTQVGA